MVVELCATIFSSFLTEQQTFLPLQRSFSLGKLLPPEMSTLKMDAERRITIYDNRLKLKRVCGSRVTIKNRSLPLYVSKCDSTRAERIPVAYTVIFFSSVTSALLAIPV